MEDQKLRTNATKDWWSKELSEIRSLLKELVGEVATVRSQNKDLIKENRDPSSPMESESLKIPRFSGDDPATWVFQVEQYFNHYNIFSDHKLSLASLYLDGEALDWYCWLFRNKQLANWDHFVEKLFIRFRVPRHVTTLDYCPARAATIASWSTMDNSPSSQYWNASRDYNNRIFAHKVFGVKPDRDVVDAEKGSISISLAFESDFDDGNLEANHIFDKMPEKYGNVDTLDDEPSKSNIEIEIVEHMETPQVGSVKSVEVAELVRKPSSITEDQVFDELPHKVVRSGTDDLNTMVHDGGHSATMVVKIYGRNATLQTKLPMAVLDDTKESDIKEEKNSLDNVVLFGKSPQRDTSEFLVPFVVQQTVMSDASVRVAETKCPFHGTLWLCTVPCFQTSLEEIRVDKRNTVSLNLNFSLCKSFWVDTGQERNISGFLLSKLKEHAMEEKIWSVIQAFAESYSNQSPNILGAFPFDAVLNELLVSLCVQIVQPRVPRPPPKPPFPTLLLKLLAQVEQSVEIAKEFDFVGLAVIDGVDSKIKARVIAANFSSIMQPAAAVVAAMLQGWKVFQLRIENTTTMLEHCFDYFGGLITIEEQSVEVHEGLKTDVIPGGVACVIHLGIVLSLWLYSNLEDKVLFEDGSIVVNQDNFERVYGLDMLLLGRLKY